jgi:hypothetical protein
MQATGPSHHAPAGQIEAEVKAGQRKPLTTRETRVPVGLPRILEVVETIVK